MQIILNTTRYTVLAILSVCVWLLLIGSNAEQLSMNGNFDHTIWNSISRDLQLNHKTQTAEVQTEIRKLLADRAELYRTLQSAAPYIYYIHQQTRARGLPAEIALIPALESEFNPDDHSSKPGARGLWQLMPQTARELGIKVKSNYDGRRNVISSTNAALAYFTDLNNCFKGNWYLAIAAYDCGQGKLQHSIRRAGSDNFWNLPLPKETKIYLPKLLALCEIIQNPAKYNIQLPNITNKPYFTEIVIKKRTSLSRIAKLTGIPLDELHALNADFKQNIIPSSKEGQKILVPIDKASLIKKTVG